MYHQGVCSILIEMAGVCLIFVADPRTAQLFRNFSRDDDRDTGPVRCVPRHADANLMYGLCTQMGNTTVEAGSGPDTWSEYRMRAPKFASVHTFRNVCRMSAVSQYCDGFF
jgi:hypothetical protein